MAGQNNAAAAAAHQCIMPQNMPQRLDTLEDKLRALGTLDKTIRQRIDQEKDVQAAQLEAIRQTINSEVKSMKVALTSHISEQAAAERRAETKDKENHDSIVRVHERLDDLIDQMKALYCRSTDNTTELTSTVDAKIGDLYAQVTHETKEELEKRDKAIDGVKRSTIYILSVLGIIGALLTYMRPTIIQFFNILLEKIAQ